MKKKYPLGCVWCLEEINIKLPFRTLKGTDNQYHEGCFNKLLECNQ